jgi:DNA-binding MltR family transcriptional regulator
VAAFRKPRLYRRDLEEYIAKKLVDDKAVAKLFGGFGPLSTFNAKIEFGFALGLLPRHVYTDLRTIRKIRNLFAHKRDSSNLPRARRERDPILG